MRPHRVLILSCISALAPLAQAVTVYGPQGRNTAAPTGSLTSAGWQWEGQFGSFLGTAISSKFFITAQHIGGNTGSIFSYNGTPYAIDSTYDGGLGYTDITGTDLRLWKVAGTLPSYAPLYGGSSLSFGSEVGKNLFVVGRGLSRGEPLTLANARLLSGEGTSSLAPSAAMPASAIPGSATALKGWLWGTLDGAQSWGTNTVSNTLTDSKLGKFITFAFNASGGANEAILAPGDSGGGVFVDVTGAGDWRLAGVNYGVDANFKGSATGATFSGSLFDEGGLWEAQDPNPPIYIPDQAADIPANSYSSSISGNYNMIQSYLTAGGSVPDATSLPEPGSAAILIISLAAGMKRSRRRSTLT